MIVSLLHFQSSEECGCEDDGGVGEGQEAMGDITASVFRRFIFVFFNMVAYTSFKNILQIPSSCDSNPYFY